MIKCIIIFIFSMCSCFSVADERMYSREDSIKNSTDAVLVLKIAGRLDCNSLRFDAQSSQSSECFALHFNEDMKRYNINKLSEDFLILKSLKGGMVAGNIVKIDYEDTISDYGNLKIGSIYLVFFHRVNDKYYYEYCDAIKYEEAKPILDKKLSYEKTAEMILKTSRFMCFDFVPDKKVK